MKRVYVELTPEQKKIQEESQKRYEENNKVDAVWRMENPIDAARFF